MTRTSNPNIHTIPATDNFTHALARYCRNLAAAENFPLSDITIYLPTRRGVRTLKDSFLSLSDGRAQFLPIMQSIGDAEMEAADFIMPALPDIPDAIDPMRRQIIIARLLENTWPHEYSYHQSLSIARDLGHLIDQIHTENLDISNLNSIMSVQEFAEYWAVTADFLTTLLGEVWPNFLKAEGMIDPGLHRHLKITRLRDYYAANPPQKPVIIAGSTGSIPATRALIKTVLHCDHGHIILPALDNIMDDRTWFAVGEGHPQYLLKNLLQVCGVKRHDVNAISFTQAAQRNYLVSEVMRPAATTAEWQSLSLPDHKEKIQQGLAGLSVCEADSDEEEATVIALAMAEIAADPGQDKTAVLITPDRTIAERVQALLQARGLTADDSIGTPLLKNPLGQFLMAVAGSFHAGKINAIALLNSLKSPFLGHLHPKQRKIISDLDITFLRKKRYRGDLLGLIAQTDGDMQDFLNILQDIYAPLLDVQEGVHPVQILLKAHMQVLDGLTNSSQLWQGKAGDMAAALIQNLYAYRDVIPDMTLSDYTDFIAMMMQGQNVTQDFGAHPRLRILGQIEARMTKADRVIMAGLNEGTWPPDSGFDVWMSRAMRGHFGLPSLEQKTSLAAHDFQCGFCAGEVLITRSRKSSGQPTLRSRWLERLDTILTAAQIDPASWPQAKGAFYQKLASVIRRTGDVQAIDRPAPCPPMDRRPTRYSVTEIEKFMRDPYWIYAKKILNLRALEGLTEDVSVVDRGTLIHEIMEQVTDKFPYADLPPDFEEQIMAMGQAAFAQHAPDPDIHGLWWARFTKTAAWIVAQERAWRGGTDFIHTEEKGEYHLTIQQTAMTLSGKADRLETRRDGTVAIIDYKTGAAPKVKDIKAGVASQLPLEAVMIRNNAFDALTFPHDDHNFSMDYWILNGAGDGGNCVTIKDTQSLVDDAEEGVKALLTAFHTDDMPYYGTPFADRAMHPAHNDYAHLQRIKEWAVQGDEA